MGAIGYIYSLEIINLSICLYSLNSLEPLWETIRVLKEAHTVDTLGLMNRFRDQLFMQTFCFILTT